ncbi:MAG TPA: cupredoxin domain-containing protein [Bdellovibrionota bacterium]|jgi:uncharacterized protein (DUF58 family)|nr:cupredoxin domain-containing protein [Bdellovibrionota bacterium]
MNRSVFFTLALAAATLAHTAETPPLEIRIKDGEDGKKIFVPDRVTVKAGERFRVLVINETANSEEFESSSMVVEKFLGPRRRATITLGPLKPGEYEFFGELNLPPPKGILTAVK